MRHAISLALLLHAAAAMAGPFSARPIRLRSPLSPARRAALPPVLPRAAAALPPRSLGIGIVPSRPDSPLAAALAAARPASPAAPLFFPEDRDEDDGLAPEHVPHDPGPQPLPPSGAMNELVFAAERALELTGR